MIIDRPTSADHKQLRQLWKAAFGDTDAFLDGFFATGYSDVRCRLVRCEGRVAAALYWFDCSYCGKPMAYLYAVATHPQMQGKGLCRTLMEDTRQHLKNLGYQGAFLVPARQELFTMYEKFGFAPFCQVREFTCQASAQPTRLQMLTVEQYAHLRRQMLPEDALTQEGPILEFLNTYTQFYAGQDFLVAAYEENGRLVSTELLGNSGAAPAILAALGLQEGRFRTPGIGRNFAMYLPLDNDCPIPGYLGLALD